MLPLLILPVITVALAACNHQQPVISEIMNYQQCRNVAEGIQQITLQQLAGIRGSRLLQPADETRHDPLTTPGTLFSIYAGSQPNSGYALILEQAYLEKGEVQLHYRLQTPAAGTITAQVVTRPCSVIQIDSASGADENAEPTYDRVVVWLDNKKIGEAAVSRG